jgi:hypothetical protein
MYICTVPRGDGGVYFLVVITTIPGKSRKILIAATVLAPTQPPFWWMTRIKQ